MATSEVLLHALRLALVHRIWLLSTEIPISPAPRRDAAGAGGGDPAAGHRGGFGPAGGDFPAARSVGGVRLRRAGGSAQLGCAREHAEIFAPMRTLFGMVREIATAVTHEVGAFG